MRVPVPVVSLNGSHGEGGGTLLRTALAMSALTQQPLRLHNIRGALRRHGLNSEDLAFIQALAESCRAEVQGNDLDLRELSFHPRSTPRALKATIDVGAFEKGAVSGGCPVIAEALIPVLARSGAYSQLNLIGETHGQNTLSFDAFEATTLPSHRAQGVFVTSSVRFAGFGTAAKGEMTVEVEPSVPEPVAWTSRGGLVEMGATVSYGDLSDDVAGRGLKRIRAVAEERHLSLEETAQRLESRSPGFSVTVWARFEHGMGSGTAIGQRGLRAELVVDNAFRAFDEWFMSEATVDAYLADQLVVTAVLAEGKTVFTTPRVTRRLTTIAWVVKQFVPIHITIKGEEGYPGTVTIER